MDKAIQDIHSLSQDGCEEVCPSCGSWHVLDANTGWCASCTLASVPAGICIRCKREFLPDRETRRICSTCRQHEWFYKNGDALDRTLATGVPLSKAIEVVTESLRPYCVSCGDPIPSGRPNHHLFCSKKRCRTAARSFKYYRVNRGFTDVDALAKVQENLLIDSLTGE